jgi:hypothetical protein
VALNLLDRGTLHLIDVIPPGDDGLADDDDRRLENHECDDPDVAVSWGEKFWLWVTFVIYGV